MEHDPTFDPERRFYASYSNDDEATDHIEVNHPSHYCNRSMEAIDIIETVIEIERNPTVAYNMSNVLKYLLRFRDKGNPVKDLQKAQWYLNRMIEKVQGEINNSPF